MIETLDHVNIRTARLDQMVAWYGRVLDLHPGRRADFDFPGAWLYAGTAALVHLVGVAETPGADARDLRLEHGAFRAKGLREFIGKLDALGERYELGRPPGMDIVQVNVWDPDGNHLHVDFHGEEDDLGS